MAVMDSALTTLARAKDLAGVPAGFTDDDDIIARFVNSMSMAVRQYCDRLFTYDTYTEQISPQNRQLLVLRESPINSITSITDNGFPLVIYTDYRCDAQDAIKGFVYKENGWMGNMLVTGMTLDPVSAARLLTVIYVAGFYLPNDIANYVEGDPASLPVDISEVVDELVAEKYFMRKRQSFGLDMLKEGGESYTFSKHGDSVSLNGADAHSVALNRYKRWAI